MGQVSLGLAADCRPNDGRVLAAPRLTTLARRSGEFVGCQRSVRSIRAISPS